MAVVFGALVTHAGEGVLAGTVLWVGSSEAIMKLPGLRHWCLTSSKLS